MEFKVNEKIDYLGQKATVVAIVPIGVHPKDNPEKTIPELDLKKYNSDFVGGGIKDHESYAISITNDSYKKVLDATKISKTYFNVAKDQLLWPKIKNLKKIEKVKSYSKKEKVNDRI